MTKASLRKVARSCRLSQANMASTALTSIGNTPAGACESRKGGPQDKQNFTLLLRELRQQLDEQGKADGKAYLLTVATPASPSHCKSIELDQVGQVVDFINLMTYDFTGAWSELTGFNSPLFGAGGDKDHSSRPELGADVSVKYYIACGCAGRESRAWSSLLRQGIWRREEHRPRAVPDARPQVAVPTGRRRVELPEHSRHRSRKPSPPRWWDSLAKVPWLYDERIRS